MSYISAILKPRDLKFGMCKVWTLLYAWQPVNYVFRDEFLFFKRLMRVGSILSRSDIKFDPVFVNVIRRVPDPNRLNPCRSKYH
jgi:hypothetical protein